MTAPDRGVTIVIPTHNRRRSVERALRALSAQSYPAAAIEVIVVADGCTDGTADISSAGWPFALQVIGQPLRGPAAARNTGAAAAGHDLLVFMDDDIEAMPGFVRAHVDAHADGNPAKVVVGYLPPDVQGRRDFFAIMLRAWWEAMFERMREPGHRFSYSDLLSGNFSIQSSMLAHAGGFDETLRCHEDYELGFRLIKAGARLAFAPGAAGWHHEHTDFARALARKKDEGRADVVLARRHPDLASALPLSRSDDHLTRRGRRLKTLALARSAWAPRFEWASREVLLLLEALRLRTRWRRRLDDLLSYWYWSGVAEALDGAPLAAVRRIAPVSAEMCDVDLRPGLEAAARELDACAPHAVRLRWGRLVVGVLPAQPGAEPLQGRHLRGLVRTRFDRQLALTLELSELLEAGGRSPPLAAVVNGAAEKTAGLSRP